MIHLDGETWGTAQEIAEDLGVPAGRLYDWRRRHLVHPVKLPNGRTMFRLSECEDVERDIRLHARSA